MSVPSSPTSQTALAFFDRDTSSWRTSQGSLLSEEHPLLERLPDSGTTAGGWLCALATPELLTNARAGGALPNLPTPAAWDGARGPDLARANRPNSGGMDLVTVTERLLPTPTSQAAKHGPTPDLGANAFGHNLWDLPHLLPTPTGRDHKGQNQRRDARCLPGAIKLNVPPLLPTPTVNDSKNAGADPSGIRHNRNTLALPSLMVLLPTPTVVDSKAFGPNINWEERLRQRHTASVLMTLPSDDGSPSLGDQLQLPPTTEDSDPSSSSG
jgi:hypothetical protein